MEVLIFIICALPVLAPVLYAVIKKPAVRACFKDEGYSVDMSASQAYKRLKFCVLLPKIAWVVFILPFAFYLDTLFGICFTIIFSSYVWVFTFGFMLLLIIAIIIFAVKMIKSACKKTVSYDLKYFNKAQRQAILLCVFIGMAAVCSIIATFLGVVCDVYIVYICRSFITTVLDIPLYLTFMLSVSIIMLPFGVMSFFAARTNAKLQKYFYGEGHNDLNSVYDFNLFMQKREEEKGEPKQKAGLRVGATVALVKEHKKTAIISIVCFALAVIIFSLSFAGAAHCANIFRAAAPRSYVEQQATSESFEEVNFCRADFGFNKPYLDKEDRAVYYSDNYVSIQNKIEKNAEKLANITSFEQIEKILNENEKLTKKLENLTYSYLIITPDTITLDAKACAKSYGNKAISKTKIDYRLNKNSNEVIYIAQITFRDDSYYAEKQTIEVTGTDDFEVTCISPWGQQKFTINVN